MQNCNSLSEIINKMTGIQQFDEVAKQITQNCPQFAAMYFAELHRRCGAFYPVDSDEGLKHEWVGNIFWAMAHGDHENGYRLLREVQSEDLFERWKELPPTAFLYIFQSAQGGTFAYPPSLKAMMYQGLWELKKLWKDLNILEMPKGIEVLKLAVEEHISAVDWFQSTEIEPIAKAMYIAQHWRSAARLALSVKQPELLESHIDKLRDIQMATRNETPHWSLSFLETELFLAGSVGSRNTGLVSEKRLETISERIGELIVELRNMSGMMHMEQKAVEVQQIADKLLGKDEPTITMAERKASILESHAAAEESGLIASWFWKQAAEEFYNAGLTEKAAEAKRKSREAIRHAHDNGEFEQFTATIPITKEKVKDIVDCFIGDMETASEILTMMSHGLFAPSLEFDRPINAPKSVFSHFAVTLPLIDDRMQSEIFPGDPDQNSFTERRLLLSEIGVWSMLIVSELFARLRSKFQLSSKELIMVFESSDFCTENDIIFIKVAADRYFDDDLVSTIHILIPRIEQLIRQILMKTGVDITAIKDGELRERPLGELLRCAESGGQFPRPLVQLLQALLSESWGMNLRNEVAHGLLKPEKCSQSTIDRLWQIALLLANIQLVPQDEE